MLHFNFQKGVQMNNERTESRDRILASYMNKFAEEFDLSHKYTEQFEGFTATLALNDVYPSLAAGQNDPMGLTLSGGDEKGLDAIIIVINNAWIVRDEEDLKEVLEILRNMQEETIKRVDYIFVQAKTSPKFSKQEMLNSLEGVEHFIAEIDPSTSNPNWKERHVVKEKLANIWSNVKESSIYLYFFAQASEEIDDVVLKDLNDKINRMNKNSFEDYTGKLTFIPCNLSATKKMYKKYSGSRQRADFRVDKLIPLPKISGIGDSYMTYIYLDEFLRIISTNPDSIKNGKDRLLLSESVFEENVRSFQGADNKVNSKILDTLKSQEGAKKFFVLNNGITMIADEVTCNYSTNDFTVVNFQIINGCQTSNMLYQYYNYLVNQDGMNLEEKLREVYIPLKIICVKNNDLTVEIVESTNNQTSIGSDQLYALSHVPREIQQFFNTVRDENDGKQDMYYERRNNEYSYKSGVIKSRIITQDMMLSIYSATYMDLPHRSSRYSGRLKTEENLKIVFNRENHPIMYFAAAYAYIRYMAESKRHSQFQVSLKWHTLMVYRILFGDIYSKASLRGKFNPEQEIKKIKDSLSSRDNLLIANNIVLKFMSDNPAYSRLSIRTINKKEEFTKDLIKYTQILKGRKSKDKYKEYLEYVFNESNVSSAGDVETLNSSDTPSSGNLLPGCTVYGIPELATILENEISEDASHLFNRIFDGTIEWGNLTFRWRNSDQKNSTYKFYIYISSKSGSNPVKVGQVVYGKRDKDFKINLGLQYKQLIDNPDFYNEFLGRNINGFTCDLTDKRNKNNKTEYGYIVFTEKSSDDLLVLINDIASKTCIVKNSMI